MMNLGNREKRNRWRKVVLNREEEKSMEQQAKSERGTRRSNESGEKEGSGRKERFREE